MQAIRIHQPSDPKADPYSVTNPAPSSALHLDEDIPIPRASEPNEVLVRIYGSTVTRDELTWPETYDVPLSKRPILGHDLSGVVVEVFEGDGGEKSSNHNFKEGDEVYGMISSKEGRTWANYAIAKTYELSLKPNSLSWAESVTVPLSALTAWQALFDRAGLDKPDLANISGEGNNAEGSSKTILITGAGGAVGAYVVQLATLLPEWKVVAASSSNARNREFLLSMGAHSVVEYTSLGNTQYDLIIDTVGGDTLQQCWCLVRQGGKLITVDSSSFDITSNPSKRPKGMEDVDAQFFIVSPNGEHMTEITQLVEMGKVKAFVAETFPLAEGRRAYEVANGRLERRGKVVLTMDW